MTSIHPRRHHPHCHGHHNHHHHHLAYVFRLEELPGLEKKDTNFINIGTLQSDCNIGGGDNVHDYVRDDVHDDVHDGVHDST